MPHKLKTFITNIGFFELALAAPSIKAALEAWDSEGFLFRGCGVLRRALAGSDGGRSWKSCVFRRRN
jgi:hypothetical protein